MSTMVSVMDELVTVGTRPILSAEWSEAGFDRHDAESWRSAGWDDPQVAARWREARPDDTADQLGRLREAGYTLELLRNDPWADESTDDATHRVIDLRW